MSFELQAVAYSSLILFVLILVQGTLVPLNQGFAWGLGSRDAKRDSTALQARASRTIANHIEGMLLFVPFAFLIEMTDLSSSLTVWGAGLYIAGRAAFAPLYLFGVAYLRSAAWGVAILGTILLAVPLHTVLF